jgi:hypothetical protein
VVSGGIGMAMFVRNSGGNNAYIEPPFMILQNLSDAQSYRWYSGCLLQDGPKRWTDRRVMAEMFREPRAIRALDQNRQRVLLVDNCGGQNETGFCWGFGEDQDEDSSVAETFNTPDAACRYFHHSKDQRGMAKGLGRRKVTNDSG